MQRVAKEPRLRAYHSICIAIVGIALFAWRTKFLANEDCAPSSEAKSDLDIAFDSKRRIQLLEDGTLDWDALPEFARGEEGTRGVMSVSNAIVENSVVVRPLASEDAWTRLAAADVVIVPDYHAMPCVVESAQAILRRLASTERRVLAVEGIPLQFQDIVSQASGSGAKAARESLDHILREWIPFPISPYMRLLEAAARYRVPVLAVGGLLDVNARIPSSVPDRLRAPWSADRVILREEWTWQEFNDTFDRTNDNIVKALATCRVPSIVIVGAAHLYGSKSSIVGRLESLGKRTVVAATLVPSWELAILKGSVRVHGHEYALIGDAIVRLPIITNGSIQTDLQSVRDTKRLARK